MTEPRISRIADADEPSYVKLALTLFALEIAAILKVAKGTKADPFGGIKRAIDLARSAYLNPFGVFRRRWVDRFGTLMRDTAGTVAQTPTLPRALMDALETRAEELGRVVTETSADKLSTIDVAAAFTKGVITNAIAARPRAQLIGTNEAFGTANLTEWHMALASGAKQKRWRTQGDELVRESHVKCGAEGFIALAQPFSNGLQHPGERPAPPEEVINCRCVLIVS